MTKISHYTGGFTQTNGYLISTADSHILIDAPEGVAQWLAAQNIKVDHVLLTHQHYDHVLDTAKLQATGAKIHACSDYSQDLTLETAARSWGMPIVVAPYSIDSILNLKAPLELAGLSFQLAFVPGHSTDSVTFFLPSQNTLFAGDTLFAGSIGRTDLPGGNHQLLLDGIAKHLLTLPPETKVLSGHGPATTIAWEIDENPFL